MKSSILFVGLDYEFVKQVSIGVANKLDMFFLDVKDLVEYSLIDTQNVKIVCGEQYLENQEKQIAISAKYYENTSINIPYTLFLKQEINSALSEKALVVLVKMGKTLLQKQNAQKNAQNNLNMEIIAQKELHKLLLQKADIVISATNAKVEIIVNKVLNELSLIK